MTDDQLDRLVAEANPVTDETVAIIALSGPSDELREAILATSTSSVLPIRRPRILAAAAVVAIVVGAFAVVFTGGGGGSQTAWAASLVRFAESSPRLLIADDDWQVTRADEYGDGEGEMTFTRGDRSADLFWRAGSFDERVDDRARSAEMTTTASVLGTQAQVSQYEGTTDFTALWPDEGRTIEFRSVSADLDGFLALLGSLERVDVDAWLSAMPASVIDGAERRLAVRAMLADVPIPPGLDVVALETSDELKDRYQLGAEVTGAVGCAWVEAWLAAIDSGDATAEAAAVAAMVSSHDWAILEEMSDEGAWPQVFWIVADGMAADGVTVDGVPVEDFHGTAIGCVPETP